MKQNSDELLADALKNSVDLKNVSFEKIEILKEDSHEVDSLVNLAGSIKSLQHPLMDQDFAQAQKSNLLRMVKQSVSEKSHWKTRIFNSGLSRTAVLMVILMVIGIGAFWLVGPVDASRAVVMDVQGVVKVSDQPNSLDWHLIQDGDSIRAGAHIRTFTESTATLVFFDGSRTTIGPDSDLTIEKMNGWWNKELQVEFDQKSGLTQHSVVPLVGKKSFFDVITPNSKVSVHGTIFDVIVEDQKQTMVSVDMGTVRVSNSSQKEIYLTSGQVVTTRGYSDIEDPAYQFSLKGNLSAIGNDEWIVAGVAFTVVPQTILAGDFKIGDFLQVKGRVLDGIYIADRVEFAKNDHLKLTFTGIVNSIGDGFWVVGEKQVVVNSETEIDENLDVGKVVNVNFTVLENGDWQAKEIESLEDGREEQKKSVKETLQETAEEISGTAEIYESPTPEVVLSVDYCTGNTDHHPDGLKLAERYGVQYDEIMGWFCQKNGFGEIDLIYTLSLETNVPVEEIFAMRNSGMGWGEVKKALDPKLTRTPKPTKTPKPEKIPQVKPTKKPK